MATERTIINGFGGAVTFEVAGETYHHGLAGAMGGDITSGGTTITADPPVALVITTYQAIVDPGIGGNIDANTPVALTITTNPASIDYAVSGSTPALTITTHRASLNPDTTITARPPVALNITTYSTTNTVTAVMGGTIAGVAEADVVSTGGTCTLTLNNDTWIAAGTGPIGTIAQSDAIVDGITSAQVEAGGWNAQIRDVLNYTDLTRTSPTVATLTIPATAGYDITATETITATIPNAVLTLETVDVVSSGISITADAGTPGSDGVSGSVTRGVTRGVTN